MDKSHTAFSNLTLDLEALPHTDQISLRQLSPQRAKIEAFYVLLFSYLPLLISSVTVAIFADGDAKMIVLPILGSIALLVLVIAFYVHLVAKRRAYGLRVEDITLKSGVVFEKTSTVPLNRIQHVEIHRPFLDRKFNLSSLLLYTAGASSVDMTIPGLENEDAQKIQARILEHISRQTYES